MNRLNFIDAWRGAAILGMIIFHFFFDLDYLGIFEQHLFSGWWLVFVRIIQISFLLLVGVSLFLSHRKHGNAGHFYGLQLKRVLVIGASALLITFVTYIVLPEAYIRFGILHFIAIAILILAFLPKSRYFQLPLLALVIILNMVVPDRSADSDLLLFLGRHEQSFRSLDYFPLFPWFIVPLVGYLIAPPIVRLSQFIDKRVVAPRWLLLFGKKSLVIYLIHQPILIGLIYWGYVVAH